MADVGQSVGVESIKTLIVALRDLGMIAEKIFEDGKVTLGDLGQVGSLLDVVKRVSDSIPNVSAELKDVTPQEFEVIGAYLVKSVSQVWAEFEKE